MFNYLKPDSTAETSAWLPARPRSKLEVMVDLPAATAARVPVIRRFSGGGTVVVDEDTILTSLIFTATAVPDVPPFPGPLMAWSESVFRGVFRDEPGFALRENGAAQAEPGARFRAGGWHLRRSAAADYVFGGKKFGGNAQSITRGRWLHHTSFLWDYRSDRLSLLRHPPRAPAYREVGSPAPQPAT